MKFNKKIIMNYLRIILRREQSNLREDLGFSPMCFLSVEGLNDSIRLMNAIKISNGRGLDDTL